jgi:predicted metalloprotease
MSRSRVRRICSAFTLLVVLLLVVVGGAQARATAPADMAPFLDGVFGDVDTYWHETFAAQGRPGPSAGKNWVAPGAKVDTACGAQADDSAAFYCPPGDTIYIGQTFASQLYDGTLQNLPGEKAGYGRAAGDFAVSYVVAHEYGHNVQAEIGLLDRPRLRALPIELNADCLAGTWAHWEYGKGRVKPGDIEEALDAALAVGDFDYLNPNHHGTPQERRDALDTGWQSGDPAACDKYLNRF